MRHDGRRRRACRTAGDLLAVEAIDRTGLVVTSEGAFVRVLRVTPPNPLILSADDRRAVAAGFCHLIGRLRPGQSLQFYLDARPVRLDDAARRRCAGTCSSRRRRRRRASGPRATRPRCRAGGCTRRWRSRCAGTPTSRPPSSCARYVVVPFRPAPPRRARRAGRAAAPPARAARRSSADCDAHRRAVRESQAHADALRAELEALGLPVRQLDGEQVLRAAVGALEPDQRRRRRRRARRAASRCSASSTPRATASRRARPRWRCASGSPRSSAGLQARPHRGRGRRDLEQVIYAHTHRAADHDGLAARRDADPPALHAERATCTRSTAAASASGSSSATGGCSRSTAAPSSAAACPTSTATRRRREYEQLLGEMAGHDRANVFEVSIYQALRARGPHPDLAALGEAVDYCAEQIESAVDCKVDRGEFRQPELWASTPAARPRRRPPRAQVRDAQRRRHGPAGRHRVRLADRASRSRSPTPAAPSSGSNPYDPEHANHTLLICGRSGSGKTMTANVILARAIAHGARAFVIDRAGHYELLTPAGRRRAADRARRRRLAVRDQPVGRPRPARGLAREGRVPDLAARADDGRRGPRQGRDRASSARRSAPSTRKAAALRGEPPRESMLRDELRAMAEHDQRDGAVDVAALAAQPRRRA